MTPASSSDDRTGDQRSSADPQLPGQAVPPEQFPISLFGRDHWYRSPGSLAARGAVAVLFGAATLLWPALTLAALVLLFGAYVLVDGVITLVALAARAPGTRHHRVLLVVRSVAGVGAGIVTLAWPAITALVLLVVIAAWLLVAGAAEVATAVRFRHTIRHHWLLGLTGVVSAAAGLGLLCAPVVGALAITWLIGWWALVSGAMLLASAWQLHHGRARVSQDANGAGRSPPLGGEAVAEPPTVSTDAARASSGIVAPPRVHMSIRSSVRGSPQTPRHARWLLD